MNLAFLQHSFPQGANVDDPETTTLRRMIIKRKALLRRLYEEWYDLLLEAMPPGEEAILEIGSGGGFFREYAAKQTDFEIVTSDVLSLPDVDVICRAEHIPMGDGALRGLTMTNVLHHVPDCAAFFREVVRVLRPGGVLAMIEPWNNPWARLVYRRLHSEPFDEHTNEWGFPSDGPMSSANSALPWIVFERDRQRFSDRFPQLTQSRIEQLMPIIYLLSGGVSYRTPVPGCLYSPLRLLERALERPFGMFSLITLQRA